MRAAVRPGPAGDAGRKANRHDWERQFDRATGDREAGERNAATARKYRSSRAPGVVFGALSFLPARYGEQGALHVYPAQRENDSPEPGRPASIGELIEHRLSRRQALKGLALAAAATAAPSVPAAFGASPATPSPSPSPSTLGFAEVPHGESESHVVAAGYEASTLIRWGDPLEAGAPAFDPRRQTVAAQAKQWGYNNDFIGYLPLPKGSASPDHGLLCVNFEYTIAHLMFPGVKPGALADITREQCEIEMAAHGHGIAEIRRDATGRWEIVGDGPLNRRITALASECRIAGPAAGDERLRTAADPTGTRVIGTLSNCAGGKTPWNTVLIAEENFNYYFGGDPAKTASAEHLKRYGIVGKPAYAWSRYFARFDVEKEPNEPNRFGWMVEIDPYDPKSAPVKRTALGRFKHEGATSAVDADGRVVLYAGDDERFQYVYKFVSSGRLDPENPSANGDLLDEGTLYAARFHDDGRLTWLPLTFGLGPLTDANGFRNQADVLIETRRAAELVGATPMDRPEDVEPNPATGRVYVVLTNNSRRDTAATDAANPRAPNPHGHILELSPPVVDGARQHAASAFTWDIFSLPAIRRLPAMAPVTIRTSAPTVGCRRRIISPSTAAGASGSPPTEPFTAFPTAPMPVIRRDRGGRSPASSTARRWAPNCAGRSSIATTPPTLPRCNTRAPASVPPSTRPPPAGRTSRPVSRRARRYRSSSSGMAVSSERNASGRRHGMTI